ncbi:MAG: DUF3047 domain-containing protein [Pseudomonadota bacterium]
MKYLAILLLLATPAAALGPVSFTGWDDIKFPFLRANDYAGFENRMEIRSEGAVSITWMQLGAEFHHAEAASWRWSVSASVPPTDLAQDGGDDRNISVYFVFADDETTARAERGASLSRVLNGEDVRVLLYTFGGEVAGVEIDSPHLAPRGKIMVRRAAGTGAFSEDVDLRGDLGRAFGTTEKNLIGIAISADSDDTDTVIEASVADLVLR